MLILYFGKGRPGVNLQQCANKNILSYPQQEFNNQKLVHPGRRDYYSEFHSEDPYSNSGFNTDIYTPEAYTDGIGLSGGKNTYHRTETDTVLQTAVGGGGFWDKKKEKQVKEWHYQGNDECW